MGSLSPKNVLITGAAGFLGPKLATVLLQDASYNVFLTDINTPDVPAEARNPQNCTCIQADLCDPISVSKLLYAAPEWHAVFIFHGIMSYGSEEDPALAERVNLDATRGLLRAVSDLRKTTSRKPRVVYASSQAVYGPPYTTQGNGLINDNTPPTPDGVYGTHKYMMELYVNDLHRRGWIDAFSVRLPTVVVRPGAPSRSAVAFLSGMVREPLAGLECIIPTSDRSLRTVICSPRVMIENFVRVMDSPSNLMPANVRGFYMPGIVVTVQEMYNAFSKVCGESKLKLLKEEPDAEAERLLRGWPQRVEFDHARRMGFLFDETCEQVFREYVDSVKASA